jgi:hypothetical protein
LVEQQIVKFLSLFDQVIGEETTVRARLEQILDQAYNGRRGKRGQMLLELNNSFGLSKGVIEKREGLQAHFAQAAERIAMLFDEGKRTGELDTTVPTPIMVATFIALLSPHGYEHLLLDGQFSSAELVTYVSRIFFESILTPTSKRT